MNVNDFGEIEQHLLAMRLNTEDVLPKMLQGLNPMQQEMLIKVAYNDAKKGYNRISAHEMAAWVDTTEGIVFTFWITLRRNYPEFDTLEKARQLFDRLTEQEADDFVRRRDLAGGSDLMGNSTGRTSNPRDSSGEEAPAAETVTRGKTPPHRTPPRTRGTNPSRGGGSSGT